MKYGTRNGYLIRSTGQVYDTGKWRDTAPLGKYNMSEKKARQRFPGAFDTINESIIGQELCILLGVDSSDILHAVHILLANARSMQSAKPIARMFELLDQGLLESASPNTEAIKTFIRECG